MLPLCSATPCSSLSQIFLNDGFCYYSRSRKLFDIRCLAGDTPVSNLSKGIGLHGVSLQKGDANSLYSPFVRSNVPLLNGWQYAANIVSDSLPMGQENLKYVEDSGGTVLQGEQLSDVIANNTDILIEPSKDEPVNIMEKVADSATDIPEGLRNPYILLEPSKDESVSIIDKVADSMANIPEALNNTDLMSEPAQNETASILDKVADGTVNTPDVNKTVLEAAEDQADSIMDKVTDSSDNIPNALNNSDILLEPSKDNTTSILDNVADTRANIPDAASVESDSLPTSPNGVENFLSDTNESIGNSISKVTDALNSSVDKVNSTITGIIKDGNQGVEDLTSKVLSSVDQTGELTRSRLSNLPNDLKEASSKVGIVALDLLRKTIIVAEDSLAKGFELVYNSYESSKENLPPEIQNVLVSFEDKAGEISRPTGNVLLQFYSAIEGLERSLGLDPSDPIVPFSLFLGTTSTLWAIYWVVTYSGYAGDLSPKLAFELLSGKDDAVLIDVRPEDLRECDGIPDLRRAARFKYVHVSFLEVDGSLKKMIKSSKDLEDTLVAAVIRNLKNVRDRSKVIVMDADGSRTKGIARSLKKLGIKRPYALQGGFQSWVKEGLRIKELKPETAITILSEEAEAILEALKPSPVQLLGIGVGTIAALYALLEWEKSLQLIGIIGLGQTIYHRVASYENPEDLWKDVGLLLSPVRVGAQAVSLVAAKRETNGNGLPVSPSSSDVQSRVLQAAAKHESQPSDEEGSEDMPLDSASTVNENVDLSEA